MTWRKIKPLIAAVAGAGDGLLVSRWTACRGG